MTRRVENPREAAAYTFGYNHSLFAHRVHDLMSLIVLVANHEQNPTSITLIGLDKTGALTAAASLMTAELVDKVFVSQNSLTALDGVGIHDPYFLPGGLKYGGVSGMLRGSKANVVIFGSSADNQSKNALLELLKDNAKKFEVQKMDFPILNE